MTGSLTGQQQMEPLQLSHVDKHPEKAINMRAPSIRWAEEREGGKWGSITMDGPAFRAAVGDLENPLSADSPLNTPRD